MEEEQTSMFSYSGSKYPSTEMVEWFQWSIERGIGYTESLDENFVNAFSDELREMSYFQLCDIFNKAKEKHESDKM